MDVKLPDGTVVQNVPDGMSRADLFSKLQASGHPVSQDWMKTGNPASPPAPAKPKVQPPGWGQEALQAAQDGMLRGGPVDAAMSVAGKGLMRASGELSEGIDRAGGWVADKAQDMGLSPRAAAGVGYAANVGMNAIPALIGPGAVGKVAKPLAEAGAGAAKAAGSGIRDVWADLMGSKLPGATKDAQSLTRDAVQGGAQAATKMADQEGMRVKAMGDVRSALEKKLVPEKAPNLDVQGDTLRTAFNASMSSARGARAEAAKTAFAEVKAAADAKEATGARVDTSAIETSLKAMLKQADGIGDLETGVSKILSAVRGKAKVPPPGFRKDIMAVGAPKSAPGPQGKTFEQLELARRYLNDIGYGADLEGYPAILRGEARTAAKAIDTAMQDFVPEFGTYKSTYRTMSEPLESLGTRFGKAISGTEGSAIDSAYAKVANADLPGKLFAKKEGIELLTDALAGGKNAPADARQQAAKQVDTMVEHWLTESLRGKNPASAVETLGAPKMRAALSAVPGVEAKVGKKFGEAATVDRTIGQLGKTSEAAAGRGRAAQDAAQKISTDLKMADTLAAQGGAASQSKALEAYTAALARGRRANLIPQEKYQAAIQLIDRAQSLEEKTARARRIAKAVGISGGALVIGREAARQL